MLFGPRFLRPSSDLGGTMRTNFGFLVLSALLLCACAQVAPYRTDRQPCDIAALAGGVAGAEKEKCPTAAWVRVSGKTPYELAYVEIDDQGFFSDREQAERAVKPTPDSPNRLTLVGHSFGASVVFNALAQLSMQRFMDGVHSSSPGRKFRGYGDLVVLINPAIEAMRYMPFQSALSYYSERSETPKADFSSELYPVLLILSSEGDWATRDTFPAARFFSTIWETHRGASIAGSGNDAGPYSEWVMDIK